jgi:hypothetical protein
MSQVKPAATMGPVKVPPPNPSNFLKKKEKTAPLETCEITFQYCYPNSFQAQEKFARNDQMRKPAVPTRNEKPVMGIVSEKDFLKTNIVDSANTGT